MTVVATMGAALAPVFPSFVLINKIPILPDKISAIHMPVCDTGSMAEGTISS